MTTLNMKEQALVDLTSEIVQAVEEIIPLTLKSSSEPYKLLKEKILSSKSHMRNTFGTTTGIGLDKYIKRRTYTLIIEEIGKERFNNLKEKEKIYNIRSFKYKCKKEFGDSVENLDTSKMQPYMDKQLISLSLEKQLETKSINSMMNSVFKEITEGRELINISETSSKILIQDNDNIIVDLDKSYFKKNNTIFNISARENVMSDLDQNFNLLFNGNIYLVQNYNTDTNIAIGKLSKFFNGKLGLTSSISICTEWGGTGWGIANLISSTSYINNNISEIELSEHDFIIFDQGKVYLNTDFYRY